MISSFENDETRIFYEGTEGDKDLWQEIRTFTTLQIFRN